LDLYIPRSGRAEPSDTRKAKGQWLTEGGGVIKNLPDLLEVNKNDSLVKYLQNNTIHVLF
jgi:hypothetical protein